MKCLLCDKPGEIRRTSDGVLIRLNLCEDHWKEFMRLYENNNAV